MEWFVMGLAVLAAGVWAAIKVGFKQGRVLKSFERTLGEIDVVLAHDPSALKVPPTRFLIADRAVEWSAHNTDEIEFFLYGVEGGFWVVAWSTQLRLNGAVVAAPKFGNPKRKVLTAEVPRKELQQIDKSVLKHAPLFTVCAESAADALRFARSKLPRTLLDMNIEIQADMVLIYEKGVFYLANYDRAVVPAVRFRKFVAEIETAAAALPDP